jgi:photosystem II stability/assembly factor-like uncharacterized protein
MYQEDGAAVRSPLEAPNTYEVTTGVAGLDDGVTWLAVISGKVLVSVDAGCNWDDAGSLPDGDWRLVAAGDRIYAFDGAAGNVALSEDIGVSWTSKPAGGPFVGAAVDHTLPNRLAAIFAGGLGVSVDAGDTWTIAGTAPAGPTTMVAGDVLASNFDVAVVGGPEGAWRTSDGGATWTQAFDEGSVTAIITHPDDSNVMFAQATSDDTATIYRTSDAGGDWAKQVDSSQVVLQDEARLWGVPGNVLRAISTSGPVHNDNTDSDGVNLYIVTAGEGTRTTYVGGWSHISQVTFGADRWIAAVDATAAR